MAIVTRKLKPSMVTTTAGPESTTILLIRDKQNLNIRFVIDESKS